MIRFNRSLISSSLHQRFAFYYYKYSYSSYNHNTISSSLRVYSSSSWDLPWSRGSSGGSNSDRKEEKSKRQQIQDFLKEQRQQRELKEVLSKVIRKHLETEYSNAFSLKSSSEFWSRTTSVSLIPKNKKDKIVQQAETVSISKALKILVSLNGFLSVELPNKIVPLAEGIVVKPNYNKNLTSRNNRRRRENIPLPILWAQQQQEQVVSNNNKDKNSSSSSSTLPVLVQDDVKLYRILENRVEQFLNEKYESITQFLTFGRKKNNNNSSDQQDHGSINDVSSLSSSSSSSSSSLADTKTNNNHNKDEEKIENLLLIDGNEIVWITNIDKPSLRLLALTNHHSYGHKASSTLISVSLVVFGAVPLAYRSLNFALSYPGLSQIIATSVIFTISYGIWSTRDIAVTRQSGAVAHGISHRIYARNDAVLFALQEGAIDRVTDGILALYNYYDGDKKRRDKNNNNNIKIPKTSADVFSIAEQVGLLQKITGQNDWLSIPIDDAISMLEEEARQ